MSKRKFDKRCCNKNLKKGDTASNHYGVIMCEDCDKKNPGLFMAAYQVGTLKNDEHYCGESVKSS